MMKPAYTDCLNHLTTHLQLDKGCERRKHTGRYVRDVVAVQEKPLQAAHALEGADLDPRDKVV